MKEKKSVIWVRVVVVFISILVFALFEVPDCKARSSLEPYKIGLSGTATGGAAGTYSPLSDGFRLYITVLNEKGGVNGREIKLVFEDNAGQGIKAGANIKRFAGLKAHLITLAAPSGAYAPAFEEAKRADIPVLCLAIGPMQTVPPKCERLIYGQAWGNALADTKIIIRIVKAHFASKVKNPIWGIGGVDIPVSRKGAEVQGAIGAKVGIKTVVKIAPLGTMDYTPIATAMMDAQCNIVSTWGPAGLTLGLFKALSKLGYKGFLYINTPDSPEHFAELMKEQPSIVYSTGQLIPLWVDAPVHSEIKAEAKKHGVRINSGLKWGWWYGMVAEEIFKKAGWPVTTEKLLNILDHLDLDFGPYFAPVKFTPSDHQGPVFENGWSWSPEKGKFIVALPWYVSNAAGTKIKVFPKSPGFPKAQFE